uniref:Reverse transcriptase domain-containing protein n=1 Tax=Peronospora matthiolae TaxID=2874970 RepID=A0AAV1T9Q8_9STRA
MNGPSLTLEVSLGAVVLVTLGLGCPDQRRRSRVVVGLLIKCYCKVYNQHPFVRCWQSRRVPQSWKGCVVRLLHTKGVRLDPSNWRPICLQQAIYKLYAGVLSRRFTRWLDVNGRHADAKKGFRAMNGCGEHNFLVAMLVDQPGASIKSCMSCDAAFTIGNDVDGNTASIALKLGVFQGCPLSPHVFNAAISLLLLALNSLPDTGVKVFSEDRPGAAAYADDLKTFSSTVDGIKRQHAAVQDFLRWTGMKANPHKYSTTSVSWTASNSYQYLGIGDGFDHVHRRVEIATAPTQVKHDAKALMRSGLAPWQVVKIIKAYLYPRVEYPLWHLRSFSQQLEGFDRHLVRGLRHLLRLLTSTTTAFFYAPVSRGGLEFLPLTEMYGALQVAHGWQMLHYPDPAIQRIAHQQLRQIADSRYKQDALAWRDREEELGDLLLNSKLGTSDPVPPKRGKADIGPLWFDVRGHLHRFSYNLEMAPAVEKTWTPAKRLELRVPHQDG